MNINSETRNTQGIGECISILKDEFSKIGYNATTYQLNNNRKLLVFDYKNKKPEIILLGHIDTVQKKDNGFIKFIQKDDKFFGPGVMDMKGGIVLMLAILNDIADENIKSNIRIVISDEEEVGSPNTKEKLNEVCSDAKYILTYEPGLSNGDYVTGHLGVEWLKLEALGKSAHAGLEPEKGINAIVLLCKKIIKISAITDLKNHLNLNAGVISGGTKANVVPDKAECVFDIRFKNDFVHKQITEKIYKIINEDNNGSAYNISQLAYLPPMPKEKSEAISKMLDQICKQNNLNISGREVGFASDGNHVASLPVSIIDGLGPYGGGMHTKEEFMLKKSFKERKDLSIELINQLLKSK